MAVLILAGGERFDGLDYRTDLLVLLVGDLRRDKNTEMTDAFVQGEMMT